KDSVREMKRAARRIAVAVDQHIAHGLTAEAYRRLEGKGTGRHHHGQLTAGGAGVGVDGERLGRPVIGEAAAAAGRDATRSSVCRRVEGVGNAIDRDRLHEAAIGPERVGGCTASTGQDSSGDRRYGENQSVCELTQVGDSDYRVGKLGVAWCRIEGDRI